MIGMAKNQDDVLLRDRMQFTFNATGDRTTLYGRIDLSAYVNPISREGLAIKEVKFQLREPTQATFANTGCFSPVADWQSSSGTVGVLSAVKIYATTRAYENAAEVGIASPDVLCVYEKIAVTGANSPSGTGGDLTTYEYWYGPADLHPDGFTVVSDLLIGIAADNWDLNSNDTIELDVLLVAEPVKISTDRINEILSQAQDL
jgi:hypothetical protein